MRQSSPDPKISDPLTDLLVEQQRGQLRAVVERTLGTYLVSHCLFHSGPADDRMRAGCFRIGASRLLRALPAGVIVLSALLGVPSGAVGQDRYRVERTGIFRRDPDPRASRLASLPVGLELTAIARNGQWIQTTLEGWVWARSLGSTDRDGFDLVVSPAGGENLRAAPNGDIVARLSAGALLDEVERQSGWVRVHRTGWVYGDFLTRVASAQSAPPPPPPARAGQTGSSAPPPAAGDVGLDRAILRADVEVKRVPDGETTGSLAAQTPVKVLARSGEWVRIQTEGWVRESDLRPAAPGVLVGVAGAEVRSRPSEFTGKLLQWTVQFIAIQRADELRRDIPEGQRYLLTRGPLPEAGFVYVVLSEEQLVEVQRLPPLAELVIIGRVRAARSQYLGNPVLDLVEMQVR